MKMGTNSGLLNEVSFPESFGFTETLSPRGRGEIMETPIDRNLRCGQWLDGKTLG